MSNANENINFSEEAVDNNSKLPRYINYGIVFRCGFKQVEDVEKLFLEHGYKIIYQRASSRKLWICEDDKPSREA